MATIITDINSVDKKAWAAYVENHADGNIFQTPEMFELYHCSELTEPIVIFAVDESKNILGILLAVVQRESKGIIGKFSSRSVIWGGPIADNSEIATLILKKYSGIARKKAIYSQFRNIYHCGNTHNSFQDSGFVYKDHLDIIMDLTQGEKALWEQVHKNRKKKINNGHNKGIEVAITTLENNDTFKKLYPFLQKLYKKIKLPVPSFEYFYEAVKIFESKGYLKTFMATCNNEIVGFTMVFVYKGLIYGWYGASDDNLLSFRPNDVLPWEILKWGANNQQKFFDFGGAGKPGVAYGVRDYKLKFGGKLVNYGRYEQVHKPFLFFIGKFGLKAWQWINSENNASKKKQISDSISLPKIICGDQINTEAWNQLIAVNNFSSPYQTPTFYSFINSLPGYEADVFAITSGNKLSSLVVVTIQKEKGVTALFSKRGIIYGGPLVSENAISESCDILNYIKDFYKEKLIYLEVRNFFNYDFLKENLMVTGWKYISHLNFQLSLLNESRETITKKFQYNRKREIRLSLEEGATYHDCEDIHELKELYDILSDLYRTKVKLPLPGFNYFEQMLNQNICKVFIVKHNNKIIGGSICPYLPGKSIYTFYYCGIKNYHKKIFPTHLAVMAAIDYGIKNSLKCLDFMGAGRPEEEYGVRKYKKEFGGTLVEHGRYVFVLKPWLYKIGVFGLKILSKVK
jgi:lipid II:glycine glycyltransferase (peptidoglycan interpeptide bridge formation enzyme)